MDAKYLKHYLNDSNPVDDTPVIICIRMDENSHDHDVTCHADRIKYKDGVLMISGTVPSETENVDVEFDRKISDFGTFLLSEIKRLESISVSGSDAYSSDAFSMGELSAMLKIRSKFINIWENQKKQ